MDDETEAARKLEIAEYRLEVAEDLGFWLAVGIGIIVYQYFDNWLLGIGLFIFSYFAATRPYRKDVKRYEEAYLRAGQP